MTSQVQLRWVAMQATGCLPFTSMLWAGHLHGHLHVCSVPWYIKSGVPGKGNPGKVRQLLAIDRTSDWSLAIYFISK